MLIKETKSFRIDTEEEVTSFIASMKEKAIEGGYEVASYKSAKKEKKAKGEVIDSAWLVEITFIHENFWEAE